MKYYFFSILTILILSFKCNNTIKTESPPPLPDSSLVLFNIPFLNDTTTTTDSSLFNKNIAQKRINEWIFFINNNTKMAFNALKYAYVSKAEYFANNTWSFEYRFSSDTDSYNAILYLTDTQDGNVILDCYYDKNYSAPRQLIRGKYDTTVGKGYLIFYKNILTPTEKIKVKWNIFTNSDTIYTKKFINLSEEFFGFYFYFAELKKTNFDIYIEIYKKTSENIYIYINSKTGEGKIKDFYSFNDRLWHCWDKNFKNQKCETSK